MTNTFQEFGFLRVAACSPRVIPGQVEANVAEISHQIAIHARKGCQIILFPELALTGYSCADLFYQGTLLNAAQNALAQLHAICRESHVVAVVGLPFAHEDRLYNCAAVITPDGVAGIVPKLCLPNTGEFYERRWFSSGQDVSGSTALRNGPEIPFGTDLLFMLEDVPHATFGIEICEDLWGPSPPSGSLAQAGATFILNPSASNELLGKAIYRRQLVQQQSARTLSAYVYASSGPGESTTDVLYSGHCLIAECGRLLAESERFALDGSNAVADIDLQIISNDRLHSSSWQQPQRNPSYRRIPIRLVPGKKTPSPSRLLRPLSPTPFIPAEESERAATCREIFAIQSTALARRLAHTKAHKAVLGISGGLDSTLALLVTVKALALLGRPPEDIVAVIMPGFGTSTRTRRNAENLVQKIHATPRILDIRDAVKAHLRDIGHDGKTHDITYENAQARERTQILMDIANQVRGIVIGTGDLSEAALGWCTYNGDHMSMYHVNIGVPKTLVRYLITWCAVEEFSGEASDILRDIADTPISPELLPPKKDGNIAQETESAIGPYELHDFFLFHFLRHHTSPKKILFLATQAFQKKYTRAEIRRWLKVFLQRFFQNQFKRSAMPDGPKVGTVALSPRGDWRMPSDADPSLWLAELE